MNLPELIEDYRTEEGNKHFYKIDGVWIWPMQNNQIFPLFKSIFEKNKIERIIEIGTAYGGLPILLRAMGFEGDIITYNIHNECKGDILGLFDKFSINQKIKDVFKHESEVGNLISSDGGTLIICDGGDKPKEVNVFSKYLKVNDIIMTHDYFDTIDKFNSGSLKEFWGVCEITYKDIEIACNKNNIKQIELNLSERSALYTGRKIK